MLHTQEVTGSSPVPPILASVLSEELGLRELLEALLGPEGRRKLSLMTKTNQELFTLYDSELVLKVHNARTLASDRSLLSKFHEFISDYPASPQLAKSFLAQYIEKKPRTLARYASTIKGFMKWYGEPMDDFKVKVPKTLPPYTGDGDIDKLFAAIENKRSHKGCIVRDTLLVALALKTGMRRGELANLEPKDIHPDFLVVRNGKGGKDRVIPLAPSIGQRLQNFIKGTQPDEKVFGLKATSIGNKITRLARKAGLDGFHAHTMRHKFATDLLEKGANIKVVQELLGHTDLGTTEVYLSVTNQGLHNAVKLLEEEKAEEPDGPWGIDPISGIKMPMTY